MGRGGPDQPWAQSPWLGFVQESAKSLLHQIAIAMHCGLHPQVLQGSPKLVMKSQSRLTVQMCTSEERYFLTMSFRACRFRNEDLSVYCCGLILAVAPCEGQMNLYSRDELLEGLIQNRKSTQPKGLLGCFCVAFGLGTHSHHREEYISSSSSFLCAIFRINQSIDHRRGKHQTSSKEANNLSRSEQSDKNPENSTYRYMIGLHRVRGHYQ